MRGRSKVTFKQIQRNLLEGAEQDATQEEVTLLNTYTKAAALHTAQGNRLINMERRMKANLKIKDDPCKIQTSNASNTSTSEAYGHNTTKASKP